MKKNLILIFLAALIISCAIHPENAVGAVDGRLIPANYFFNSLRNNVMDFSLKNGRNPNQIEKKKLADITWNQIVKTIVYQKLYSKYNLSVSNKEINDYLIRNVPDFLKNNKKLQYRNKFSETLYLSSVKNNKPLDLTKLKKDVYYILINQKLKKKVLENYSPSTDEIKEKMEKYYLNGDFKAYYFSPEKFDFKVERDEIKKYYMNNIKRYKIRPYVNLEYVEFPIKLGDEDYKAAKHIADSLYMNIKKGVSFSFMVNQKSDLYSGIENPFIYLDSLKTQVRTELGKLSESKFSKPFLNGDSYYLIYLQRKTKNMVKYMEIQIPVNPTDFTLEKVKDKVRNFKELTDEIGLERAVEETDYNLIKAGKIFLDNPIIKGLGRSDSIINKALKSDDKFIAEYHPYLKEFIFFYVKSKQKKSYKNISEVIDKITEKIKLRKLREFLEREKDGKILDYVNQGKAEVNEYQKIGYLNFDKKCGEIEEIKENLFANLNNYFTRPKIIGDFVIIAQWKKINKLPVDFSADNKYKKIVIENLKEKYFKKYIESVFEKVTIKDWRRDYR